MHRGDIQTELELNHNDCYSWALHCCNGDRGMASDVLQTSYVKMLEKQNTFRGGSVFKTWAFIIIKNTAIDALRKRKKEDRLFQSEDNFPDAGYETNLEDKPGQKLKELFFKEALSQLSERQKEIMQLVFYHDLSLNETAEILNISQGSVRKHYDRAKKFLAVWFQQHGLITNNIYDGSI